MTLYRDSKPGFGRYGSLPSVCDSTALDEIALYGDLLQAVAASGGDADEEGREATGRLDWDVIDRALGVKPRG
jgi:hypothetical protein